LSGFPSKELYNLSSQIRRAADSIGLNIAEGSSGHTDAEQKRFSSYMRTDLGWKW
jgi:four helix bundle protein